VRQPLVVTEAGSRFNVDVKCAGGGPAGQAGAVRHGIARALLEMDEALREPLRRQRPPHPRPPRKRIEEVRPQTRPQRFQFSKR